MHTPPLVDLQTGERLSDFVDRNFDRQIKRPTGEAVYTVKGIASTGKATHLIVEREDGRCTTLGRSKLAGMVYADE